MSQTITIYGKKLCVFCDRAKALANDLAKTRTLNIQFVDIEEEGITREDLASRLGLDAVHTVPQVLIDDQYIGGFTEFREQALEHNWVGNQEPLIV